MSINIEALKLHKKFKGKIEVKSKIAIKNRKDLSLLYTPGVAAVSMTLKNNINKTNAYTSRGNMIAVISDGSAVLGLGNIGPEAALPVMEGKAVLFKRFGNIDAFPIVLSTQNPKEIIETIKNIAPSFSGINLEDISAPRCFEIEGILQKELNIPVFHDDQHGTAVVVSAALRNALKVVKKDITDCKVVINGAGAAGNSIAKMISCSGYDYCSPPKNMIVCDSKGIISKDRHDLNTYKKELAKETNKNNISGTLSDALDNADVFIGVSKGNIVTAKMIKKMNKHPIIFAMANPVPEIMPEQAYKGGAFIVATGRSDYPNQVNNLLAFPGIFRGVLDARASSITNNMMMAASNAISKTIKPSRYHILPSIFNKKITKNVVRAVKKAWLGK